MKKTIAILIILSLLLSACGASTAPMEDMKAESNGYYAQSGSSADLEAPAEIVTEDTVLADRKLIRTVTMDVETEDLDTLLGNLQAKLTALGGYVEHKSVRGSSTGTGSYRAELTLRVPSSELSGLVSHVTDSCNILSQTEGAQDITLSYSDTESRIEALETEQTRLLELLAKAGNIEDLLSIEQRLTGIRAELLQENRRKLLYDNQVDYATVNLSISQVREYTPVAEKTLLQKLGTSLSDSWEALGGFAEGVLIALVALLPWLIPISLATGITVLAIKLSYKKKKA